jgi:hypothetical protein
LLPSIVTGLIFLAVFGGALGSRLHQVDGVPYVRFMLPGRLVMTVAAGAFANSSTSLFQAKNEGYLDDLLSSPLRPWQLAAGYMSGGLLRGWLGATLLALAASPFAGAPSRPLVLIAALALTGLVFAALGTLTGVRAESFDQHAFIANLLITPLALLGGVFYASHRLRQPWHTLTQIDPPLLPHRCHALRVRRPPRGSDRCRADRRPGGRARRGGRRLSGDRARLAAEALSLSGTAIEALGLSGGGITPRGRTRLAAVEARLLDRAVLELSQLLAVGVAELLEELARRLRLGLVDPGHREADVDQHPVARLDRVLAAREQADVDLAPHAGDLGRGDQVLLVDELDDLSGDSETHVFTSLSTKPAYGPGWRSPALPPPARAGR